MQGMISFTSCPYYTLNKKLSGPCRWSGCRGKDKSSCLFGECNSTVTLPICYPNSNCYVKIIFVHLTHGASGSTVGWGTALLAGRLRVWFPMVSVGFFIDIILPAYYGTGVDSASKRNEYQEYFLGGEGSQCIGLTTLPLSCVNCLEIWEP